MALFDVYVMVDWSAASKPVTGKDSIWLGITQAGGETTVENISTRLSARGRLHAIAADCLANDKRLLIGFDFPFGYPAGTAKAITGHGAALALWRWIAARIKDGADNSNNRFEVASELNRLFPGNGPFWGRHSAHDWPDIPFRKSARFGIDCPTERRLIDAAAKTASSVWQLYSGPNVVGSQALTGLPHVLALRDDPELAADTRVWPFETGLTEPTSKIVLAEIYPSLIAPDPSEEIRDAGQVRAVVDWLSGLDRDGALGPAFAGPANATSTERALILTEEAWILGFDALKVRSVGSVQPPGAPPAQTPRPQAELRYERDPAAIYRQSFETVRREAELDHLPADLREVAIRLVHACGMPEITARLAWSSDVAASASDALHRGAPILCDCEAVASMVIRRTLPAGNPVICTLNDAEVPALAKQIGNTRSAAAVRHWQANIEGAVVAIGNAPTALFHLLEQLDGGWPRPAAILAFPVGFVGAAESKAELAGRPRETPFLTLRGRRGGSAMAAAAVNALASGLRTTQPEGQAK